MIDENTKVVWILGAGFSRALGGPLLRDLLHPYSNDTLMMLHEDFILPNVDHPDKDRRRAIISRAGKLRRAYHEASRKPGCPWSDAEQFLDLIETAASEFSEPDEFGTSPPSHVLPITSSFLKEYGLIEKPSEIALAARQAIAADCSLFLRNAQVASEKWSPYREWAQSLGSNHVVVTFNYDLIPDLLEKHDGNLFIPIPSELDGSEHRSNTENKARVYKVHGSVNWFVDRGGSIGRSKAKHGRGIDLSGNICLENNHLDEFAIGVPGPQKSNLVSGALNPLWLQAMKSIREADLVIFVGYRFPPSDAQARRDILNAIREKERRGAPYSVHRPQILAGWKHC